MLFFYIIFCIIIICINYHYILPTLKIILTQAFSTRAIGGGFFGTGAVLAIRYGFSRGLFCSESGFGNTPIASCTAQTKNPVRQALVSMTAVFWDTLVVSTLTGMVLVLSIFKNAIVIEDFSGSTLALNAFNAIEGIVTTNTRIRQLVEDLNKVPESVSPNLVGTYMTIKNRYASVLKTVLA